MKAAHTLGPWWVTDSGVRDKGGYICHTNPAMRYEGQDERFAEETAERAANKLLIAAAPELLAACEAIVRYQSLIDSDATSGLLDAYGAAFEGAETAVAKATGKGLP